MPTCFSGSMITVAIAAAVSAANSASIMRASAQTPSAFITPAATSALKTPWGEPDLQGIWTDEFDTPFQRPAKYANQEFFTEEQREELDKARATLLGRRATERELVGDCTAARSGAVRFRRLGGPGEVRLSEQVDSICRTGAILPRFSTYSRLAVSVGNFSRV
jgi:hypothetical protein